MRSLGKLIISPWLIGLLLLCGSLIDYPTLLKLEYPIYDQLLEFRKAPDTDRVALIATDQDSPSNPDSHFDSAGDLAAMIDEIKRLGGKKIAVLTPFNLSETASAGRLALQNSLRNHHVIIAAESTRQEISSPENFSAESLLPAADPLPNPQQLLLSLKNPLAHYRLNQPKNWEFFPAGLSSDQTPQTGHLIFSPDPDGKIRSQILLLPWRKRLFPSLPLQLAVQASGENLQNLQINPAALEGILQTGSLEVQTLGDYRLLFDIHPDRRPFHTYKGSDLLQGNLKRDVLAGKVVLIGPTNSYGDRHQIAGYGSMSTSELAALATATLLANSAPQRPDWAWFLEAAVLFHFVILLSFLVPRLSSRAGFITLLSFLIGWILAASGALIIFNIWLKIIPAILLCTGGFTLVHWHIGYREKHLREQENYRTQAQRFQEQGLLDLALEKGLLIDPKIKLSKAMLYSLGLEFERKRMPHNAILIYQHLLQAGRFRDIKGRLKQLKMYEQTTTLGRDDNTTVILNHSGEKPTLGRYQIERELGQGAMGTVYLGIDPKINRQVAIKTLAYHQIDTEKLPQIKERFFREAEAVGKLSHPNIVTIYDVGEETDLAFFAMELLEGKDLSYYCCQKNQLPATQVINIISQVATALDYAHRQGVIHRDIKPSNLILLQDGQIKVTDFGIARITTSSQTKTGIVLGTPSYMSPEQVAGKKVEGRSDIFSLGVVMYELFSGEKPFQGESMAALMYNISNTSYRPLVEVCPQLPAPCYTIVDKLLQKTFTRRFKSAAILQQELLILQKKLKKP